MKSPTTNVKMFRSVRGSARPIAPQRPSTNTYSSYRDRRQDIPEDQQDRKRKLEPSSDQDDEIDIIHERIRRDSSRHDRKKKKRKKDKKERKKKEKRRRRNSSTSSSSSGVAEVPAVTDSFFTIHRKRAPSDWNRPIERRLSSRPLKLATQIPLTPLNFLALNASLMQEGGGNKEEWRYFCCGVREQLQNPAKERVFRQLQDRPFFINGEASLSTNPCDPTEEHYYANRNNYREEEEEEESLSSKEKRIAGFDQLTTEQRIKKIKRDINIHDSDVNKWLKFLKLEDRNFESVTKAGTSSRGVTRNAFLERRLEIIRQGLKRVPKKSSMELHLEELKTMAELYGYFSVDVTARWKELLNRHVNSLDLWKSYIRSLLHNRDSFDQKKMLEIFDTAITRLSAAYTGTLLSHPALPGTEEVLIDLVVNQARLMMETGHIYSVVAVVTAVAEFYFFMPDEIKQKPWAERLKEFKDFWISGAPRLGDKDSKGWKHSNIHIAEEMRVAMTQYELDLDKEANEREDKMERKLLEDLKTLSGVNRFFVWHELETFRSKMRWRPVRILSDLLRNIDDWASKIVAFDAVKSSILPLNDPKLSLKLLFRLLQILGAVIPGLNDTSHFGLLNSILPGGFDFMVEACSGMSDFVTEFLFQLSGSDDIPNVEQILASITATKLRFMEFENASSKTKRGVMSELQTRIVRLPITDQVKFCVTLQAFDIQLKISNFRHSLTGYDLPEFGVETRLSFENIIKIVVSEGDLCEGADNPQKQLLLHLAFSIAIHLPSHKTGSAANRLRFLTLLVLGRIQDFFKADEELEPEMITEARNRWFNRMQDLLDSDDLNIDFYTFMETPRNSIFKLYTLFEFEDSKKCPFTFSPISQDIRFSEFIEKSPERTQFRLDFSYALCTTPKIFACSWSNYSMWTLSAIKKNPEFIGHYRSLVYLFESLPCRFKHLCEWKELDSKDKRNRAFSMFVAEYKLYKKAQEIHETPAKATADKKIAGEQKEFAELRVKSSYKRIQQILEEAAPLLSDSFEPDSLIWRLWYHIEKSNKNRTEMEKVYILGVNSCPFSKQLMVDATDDSFMPASKLEEVTFLADKHGLKIHTLPNEADALVGAVTKQPKQ